MKIYIPFFPDKLIFSFFYFWIKVKIFINCEVLKVMDRHDLEHPVKNGERKTTSFQINVISLKNKETETSEIYSKSRRTI
jgi:hypothetical protein